MKRNISFKIVLFLVIGVLAVTAAIRGNRLARELRENVQVGTFQVSEFTPHWEEYPAREQVGLVSSAETAIEKATELIMETLADTSMNGFFGYPEDPTDGRPLKVFYDEQSACWLVHGTMPPGFMGVSPYALIQRDGTVLSVGYN